MTIYQFTPTIAVGDAVGNDVLAVHRLLKGAGYDAVLCAENFSEGTGERIIQPPAPEAFAPEDVLLWHHSIVTGRVGWLKALPCRKALVYHNITPAEYFAPYNRTVAERCRLGREELAALRGCFAYAMADSAFNREELLELGYTCPIDVQPILVPFDDYAREPDKKTLSAFRDGRTNLLFVGRVVPNKKHEDILRAFACYKQVFDPTARLILVGGALVERYKLQLLEFIRRNNIGDVVFPGHIRFEQLLACYRAADVFLCMSEHEGFCVPLLESMYFDLPILARAAGAVPDTLNGAGLLLPDNDPALAAAAIDRVVHDRALRKALIAGQRRRLRDFSYEAVSALLLAHVRSFIEGERA